MKTVVPDYYGSFHCIADRCRHTCCVGWEIDVDAAALARYAAVQGPLGQKLRDNIVRDECPHFRLTADERCPFLNEKNLCELFLALGEDSLCQICTDHPRFRNVFSDRVETGLGLCCEAAGALILGEKKICRLQITGSSDESPDELEQQILAARGRAFAILQNREQPVEARVKQLLAEFEIAMPQKTAAEWADFFLSLERLDAAWDAVLLQLKTRTIQERPLPQLEIPLEQLLVYLVYRHLPAAQDETDISVMLGFAVLGYRLVKALCMLQENGCSLENLVELARLFSSEIEYSEENTDAVLDLLWDENAPSA